MSPIARHGKAEAWELLEPSFPVVENYFHGCTGCVIQAGVCSTRVAKLLGLFWCAHTTLAKKSEGTIVIGVSILFFDRQNCYWVHEQAILYVNSWQRLTTKGTILLILAFQPQPIYLAVLAANLA